MEACTDPSCTSCDITTSLFCLPVPTRKNKQKLAYTPQEEKVFDRVTVTVSPDTCTSDLTTNTAPEYEKSDFGYDSDESSNTFEFTLEELDFEAEFGEIECNDPNCIGYELDDVNSEQSSSLYPSPNSSNGSSEASTYTSVGCDSSNCKNNYCAIKMNFCAPVSRKVRKAKLSSTNITSSPTVVSSDRNDSSASSRISTSQAQLKSVNSRRSDYSIPSIFILSGIILLFITSKLRMRSKAL